MFEPPPSLRLAGRQLDLPGGAPEGLSLLDALRLARAHFDGFAPAAAIDVARLRKALRKQAPAPALDRERWFFLGWLAWLEGNLPAAEGILADAERRCRDAAAEEAQADLPALEPAQLLARVTYWRARVGLLAGHANAVSDYEGSLRRLAGWPQASAWYVDLLWRSGRVDRAEGVWKSVRGNKRVAACEEAPLLDARAHLRKGELAPAERLLREASPAGGVVWVERELLLAWALAGQRKFDAAREALREAGRGPYPPAALDTWRAWLDARVKGIGAEASNTSLWRPYLAGQAERAGGDRGEAAAGYRVAAELALTAVWARYGLACLGEEDPAALLASAPGMFLAVRCRAQVAMARFARRELGPGEVLEALRQAESAGYTSRAAEHFARLARALAERQATPERLRQLVATETRPAERANAIRVGLGLLGGTSSADALALLAEWQADEAIRENADLHSALSLAMRRFSLLDDRAAFPDTDDHPAGLLARLADRLARGATLDDADRERARTLVTHPHYRGVAQAVLLHEAAARGDLAAVTASLEARDAWRGQRPGPPRFVVRALAALVAAHPTHVAWRQALGPWLSQWGSEHLGAEGAALASAAGVAPLHYETAVPDGVEPAAWLLHQASRAARRGAMPEALAAVRRAAAVGPLPPAAEAAVAELERLSDAAALTQMLPGAPGEAAILVGLVEELRQRPEGEAVLAAARAGDGEECRRLLDEIAPTPALHHHLALLATRDASRLERADPSAAAAGWRRAWAHWVALLRSDAAPEAAARAGLLDHLLAGHRARLSELLRQGEVEPARRFAELVRQLPDMAGPDHLNLREDLARRVERFRDELATEHLLSTRDAMRFGDIPAGWRADYERGLTSLRRLMALDRDNVRLLTAVVETCADWFLDLYNAHDADRLRQEVERYAPLATHLVRLIASQPGEHPARPALSELYKFRGFVEPDPASRANLYREALRLCPSNDNVRELLARLEGESAGGDDEG